MFVSLCFSVVFVTYLTGLLFLFLFFFFNDPAPTEIYTLPLHDPLPIPRRPRPAGELEVPPVVEEQLGDEEVRSRLHLGLAVAEVLAEVAGLGVPFGIASAADAEVHSAQIGRAHV